MHCRCTGWQYRGGADGVSMVSATGWLAGLLAGPAAVLLVLGLSSTSSKELGYGYGKPLPSFLKVCHKSDRNLNECVQQSVAQLRPYLAHGIPELGIPPCEPLVVSEVVVNQGKGLVTVTSTYRDIHVYGATKFRLKSIKIDLEKNRLRVRLFIPYLQLSSEYLLEGRILMLPIQGRGQSSGNYTDIEATATMTGQRVIKDGKEYMNIKEFLVEFQIGHAVIHLSNLFDGDEELGSAMNRFLNENWRNVVKEIQPVLEDTIAELFKNFANKIFHMYPLDVLLPD